MSLACTYRAYSNGSIRRAFKADTSDAVTLRSGLGVNLKDVTIFNRGREKGTDSPPANVIARAQKVRTNQ